MVCQFALPRPFVDYHVCLHMGKAKSLRPNELFRPSTIPGIESKHIVKLVVVCRVPMILVNSQAPYLPWVLVAFSVLLGNSVLVDILGIAIGHLYFFLEDVFPNQPGGRRLLATPRIL